MTRPVSIAPSILSADFLHLGREIEEIARADLLHFDVMDGHFVPNLSFGPGIMRQVRAATALAIDAHLMVTSPEDAIDGYIEAGADIITFHAEACDDPDALIERIHELGASAGIALSPDTPVETVFPYLGKIELVLVMTVHPGFGGQRFIEAMLPKIEAVAAACASLGVEPMIEVDGGIAPDTIGRVAAAGANVFVAGSAIFGAADKDGAIAELRRIAEGA